MTIQIFKFVRCVAVNHPSDQLFPPLQTICIKRGVAFLVEGLPQHDSFSWAGESSLFGGDGWGALLLCLHWSIPPHLLKLFAAERVQKQVVYMISGWPSVDLEILEVVLEAGTRVRENA